MGDLLAALNDPSLRSKLRKVTSPTISTATAEEKPEVSEEQKAKMEEERQRRQAEKDMETRQTAFIELLGYMEAPDGSVEEIVEALAKSTNVARGFIFSLVRRGWVEGFRLLPEASDEGGQKPGSIKGPPPCTVWPGREWTNKIDLPTYSTLPTERHGVPPVMTAHMYRFDQELQQHLLDEILLFQTKQFPAFRLPFGDKEPTNDGSLASLQAWERWNQRKLAYQQSDHAQCTLMLSKLKAADSTLCSSFASLQGSIGEMRKMSSSIESLFEGMETKDVVRMVESVPAKIRELAKQVEEETGIRVREEGLKLTPAFLKQLVKGKKFRRIGIGAGDNAVRRDLQIPALSLTVDGHDSAWSQALSPLSATARGQDVSSSPVKVRRRLSARY